MVVGFMNSRILFLVGGYELKLQSRSRIFRLFLFLSLIGIVACHAYWQGDGICRNWKMVALPCSMPLVNAYLFGIMQSIFLIAMMADVPRRLIREGSPEALYVRPMSNSEYYWGVISGNLLLFLLADAVIITISILSVNLTSLAPVSLKYYLFYLLTLTIPSWVFAGGLTLWLSYLFRSRVLAMVIPVFWLAGSIFWLPYHFHGTLDYLASGIPNVFSDMVGHVDGWVYIMHRLTYLFLGFGFLVLSARKTRRLPNSPGDLRGCRVAGLVLLLGGMSCAAVLEYSYYRDRQVRASYRASFERNWQEQTCRVKSHGITLEQEGKTLKLKSDLLVYNPGREPLEQLILLLNPGLRVMSLQSGEKELPYRRDNQFILIDWRLGAGDSLQMRMEYEGMVDDRFCDLHLTDEVYENPFYNDRFFATGRQGAFVEKELLLLTPASVWYPMAIPPVNPVMPIATGRDFTRFRLLVKHPLQKEIVSQGQMSVTEDSVVFSCHNTLSGISLCGANYNRHFIPVDDKFGLQLNTMSFGKQLANNFSGISPADFILSWEKFPGLKPLGGYNYETASWYEPKAPYLYLLEVPVSFRLETHAGKPEAGLVEPGMIFLRERGFDMNIAQAMEIGKVENEEEFIKVVSALGGGVFSSQRKAVDSHPLLGFVKKEESVGGDYYDNDNGGYSLREVKRVWVHSLEYPFMGKVLEGLYSQDFNHAQGLGGAFPVTAKKEDNDYLTGKSLTDILGDNNKLAFSKKLNDLWLRLTLRIPGRELRQSIDSVYEFRVGEVDYDSLILAWTTRWGTDIDHIMRDWMTTRHEQYFKVKDAMLYYDPETRRSKAIGKIMNAGKSGGIVSIEYGFLNQIQRSVCYFEPGEAKAFTIVTDMNISSINTGLSANRPTTFYFQQEKADHLDAPWELEEEWRSISVSEFMEGENPDEFVVDDQDAGFSLQDGSLSWLQRRRKTAPPLVPNSQMGGEDRRWKRVVDAKACGDSIRGYHYIGGGYGKSTATWRLNIPEAGRYRVMAMIYKDYCKPVVEPITGVVYYYTLSSGNRQEEVAVSLDEELSGFSGWVTIGEYDFPTGEVSVTLSDKEVRKRKEVAIVADAVKFVKLE